MTLTYIYTVLIGGKKINVSVDRLKPAFIPILDYALPFQTVVKASVPLGVYRGAKKKVSFAELSFSFRGE